MYKIYINDKPLILVENKNKDRFSDFKVVKYTENPLFFTDYIEKLEKKEENTAATVIYSTNVEQMFDDFKSHFKIIEAAGGIVFQPSGELLAIYRLKTWDLPKGKIDKGEKPKEAAIREVQEETGIEHVSIDSDVAFTWHTYWHPKKQKRILKKTHWYIMKTTDTELTPQLEEDIEIAQWMTINDFFAKKDKMYQSIYNLAQDMLR